MKKLLSVLLALTMCLSMFTFTVSAAKSLDDFELPKPQIGYLHIHHDHETWDDEIDAYAFIDQSVLDLILESQEDDFYEKYDMASDSYKTFGIYMQIDTSVDDRNSWAYKESWDREYDSAYDSPTMSKFLNDASKTVGWGMGALYHDQVKEHYGKALVEIPDPDDTDEPILRFDIENHTVYVRYRYLMIYGEGGNDSYKTSEWSDVWSVGKNGTQNALVQPTALVAPVISELKQDADGTTGLDYIIDIPQSIYDAEMDYNIIEDIFEPIKIETQLSINGGEWQSGYTANAAWLDGGWRSTNWETPIYGQKDNIKLKVRFVANDAGLTSEWSNVLELNAMAFNASAWAQAERATPKHIQDFYTKQRQRVKGTTVKSYHANIHKAFKDARKLQLIESNPMECVDPPKKEPYHGKTYTVEEAQKILALVSGTIFEIPITMMLFYGLCREEAIGLKWQNIDFENDTFLIAHTVTEASIDGHLQVIKEDLTKNSSSYRSLPLVAPVKKLLLEKKQIIQEFRKLFRRSYYRQDSDYVCVNEIGELIKPRTLSDNFKRIIRQNNIRNLRLYDCRHTAASIMLKNGVNMKKIQLILGHSDYSTTANIYSHLDYSDKIPATEMMKEIIYGKDDEAN